MPKIVMSYIKKKSGLIAFIAVALFLLSGCSSSDDSIKTGTVVSKRIVGVASDGEHEILMHRPDNLIVFEEKYKDYLHDTGGEGYIDQPMAAALREDFPDVRYIVDVNLCEGNENRSYYTSRVIFNQLLPGEMAKFEPDEETNQNIARLIE